MLVLMKMANSKKVNFSFFKYNMKNTFLKYGEFQLEYILEILVSNKIAQYSS
jgi:hypothetical protein